MSKQRTHKFVINVTFGTPCTRAVALRNVRNDGGIGAGKDGGVHYCTQYDPSEPAMFNVRSVKPYRGASGD